MEVSLKQIEESSRHILENLFPYYIYDMSEFMGWNPNEEGHFTYPSSNFDVYWEREDHTPFFIYVEGVLAGFVLVRKYPNNQAVFDVAQFFVLRKFKRMGVGKKALHAVVDRFPGHWQIRVLIGNHGALKFWQSAVENLVGNAYSLSKDVDTDLEMHFIRFQVH
ncbi:putative Acyl-CoA N-acyltransferase [Vibrio nigripulchritudo SO65]|uniref:GNAT family N-acetyltransferase n=1 Tax=Vibrio nigripulchritudo TaxID=28173 RepID=UPI0003B18690|nr:GNAT family N-acetyltransferase [Vibrio nigripulchritudo]CCN37702.1 putative Acyl-CoA N-acyltransferase [Vibrio nigripulchritudo AM115]CCN39176.1 putative Acyl-CoA N-acyltransferase [Vibrio nigripulchritudo FTn2]CCN67248.1 putative Acyl-CoA N-acyltransferase [Vibrio nigripulchritudo POn4]CCN78562.1 putative Acyl-CoA N-acyltransferase [Vibrio nigripulchritudo SO65]